MTATQTRSIFAVLTCSMLRILVSDFLIHIFQNLRLNSKRYWLAFPDLGQSTQSGLASNANKELAFWLPSSPHLYLEFDMGKIIHYFELVVLAWSHMLRAPLLRDQGTVARNWSMPPKRHDSARRKYSSTRKPKRVGLPKFHIALFVWMPLVIHTIKFDLRRAPTTVKCPERSCPKTSASDAMSIDGDWCFAFYLRNTLLN
jgi:hypothetical protein